MIFDCAAMMVLLQGSFNLYSDGIEHGCRLVVELPLYSHPTNDDEDQIQFSALEEEGSSTTRGTGTMVADGPPSNNVEAQESSSSSRGSISPVVAEIGQGTVDIADISQFREIPFPEELLLSGGPAQEAAITVLLKKETRLHSKTARTSFSSHSKVYPDAACNEKPFLDLKVAGSSLEIEVAFTGSGGGGATPNTSLNELRFLIVVSWALNSLSHSIHSYSDAAYSHIHTYIHTYRNCVMDNSSRTTRRSTARSFGEYSRVSAAGYPTRSSKKRMTAPPR